MEDPNIPTTLDLLKQSAEAGDLLAAQAAIDGLEAVLVQADESTYLDLEARVHAALDAAPHLIRVSLLEHLARKKTSIEAERERQACQLHRRLEALAFVQDTKRQFDELESVIEVMIAKRIDEQDEEIEAGGKTYKTMRGLVLDVIRSGRLSAMKVDEAVFAHLVEEARERHDEQSRQEYQHLLEGRYEGSLMTLHALLKLLTARATRSSRGSGRGHDDSTIPPERFLEDYRSQDSQAIIRQAAHITTRVPEETLVRASVGHIRHQGGRLYYVRTNSMAFMKLGDQVFEVSTSDRSAFHAWLQAEAGISAVRGLGRSIAEALVARARSSKQVRSVGRLALFVVDKRDPVLLLHLHQEAEKVLRVSSGKIEVVGNGEGADGLVLPSPWFGAFEFSAAWDPQRFIDLVCARFLAVLPLAEPSRWFVLCYLLSVMMRDAAGVHPLLNVLGDSDSGKTFVAKLMSVLFYGEERLIIPTVSALYSSAAQNALILIDNREVADSNEGFRTFLLVAVTRAQRVKRAMNTASEVVIEDPNAMVVTTSIESENLQEILNRTFSVMASKDFWLRDPDDSRKAKRCLEETVLGQLREARGEILSGALHLLAQCVLPAFVAGKLEADFAEISGLMRTGRGDRCAGYLAVMKLWLDALAPLAGIDAAAILRSWLAMLGSDQQEEQAESSQIVRGLEAVLADLQLGSDIPPYSQAAKRGVRLVRVSRGQVRVVATMNALLAAIRDLVSEFQIHSGANLYRRLRSEASAGILTRAGWSFERTGDKRQEAGHLWCLTYAGPLVEDPGVADVCAPQATAADGAAAMEGIHTC